MSVRENVAYGLRMAGAAGAGAARVRRPWRWCSWAISGAATAPALRRAAAAGRAGPGAGQSSPGPAARRAARRARPQAPRRRCSSSSRTCSAGGHHLRLRDPRSGRSAHDERSHRGHEEGRIEQLGTPDEIYHRPVTSLRRRFHRGDQPAGWTGAAASGRDATLQVGGTVVRAPLGRGGPPATGAEAWLSIRPERLAVGAQGEAGAERNSLDGVVADVVFVGAGTKLYVALADGTRVVAHRRKGPASRRGRRSRSAGR